jgi:hypothetical protein
MRLGDLVTELIAGTISIRNLAALSLFNNLDYGLFYTQQDPLAMDGCKVNYLLNRYVYQMPTTVSLTYIGYSPYQYSSRIKSDTINLLCWGSNTNLGTVLFLLIAVPDTYARQLRFMDSLVERSILLDKSVVWRCHHCRCLRQPLLRQPHDLLELLFVVPPRS